MRSRSKRSFSMTGDQVIILGSAPACVIKVLLITLLHYSTSDIEFHYYANKQFDSFFVAANSINYGISQETITDINLLMPKLCQNSSVCEGSFCIPGLRKCICDLRMPVSLGRYCLRQVDIDAKCFATSQCNHTLKEAVCIDVLSNAVLDVDSSKFKLDQWQQLSDLRQQQQARETYGGSSVKKLSFISSRSYRSITDNRSLKVKPPTVMDSRNSPYEFKYNTQQLLLQNHTRRNFSNEKTLLGSNLNFRSKDEFLNDWPGTTTQDTSATSASITSSLSDSSTAPIEINPASIDPTIASVSSTPSSTIDQTFRKKVSTKNPVWPPGVCSCPLGSMFNSMLRRCIAISLADSHCFSDSDCRQFAMTHCSTDTRKCHCDEPLSWDQRSLACVKPSPTTTPPSLESTSTRKDSSNSDSLLPPLILAKLLPDYTLLPVFAVIVVVGILILLKFSAKCSSSNSSALISPKNKKKKAKSSNLPPRSPYATLRRPDHKPSSELSTFTQATRGRILNYDFEQEESPSKVVPPHQVLPDVDSRSASASEKPLTLSSNKGHKHQNANVAQTATKKTAKTIETDDGFLELTDNISLSQQESDTKADNNSLSIPAPPPPQQPPYMLASAMKGQGSAIAAAAAAVANKRIQMAQQKNLDPAPTSGKVANGSPVFL